MPVSVTGKKLIESGSVVMAATDSEVLLTVGELFFQVVWEHDDGAQQHVVGETIGEKGMKIRLINADGAYGTTYIVEDIGTVGARPLGMGLFWDSVRSPEGMTRSFNYSFWTR